MELGRRNRFGSGNAVTRTRRCLANPPALTQSHNSKRCRRIPNRLSVESTAPVLRPDDIVRLRVGDIGDSWVKGFLGHRVNSMHASYTSDTITRKLEPPFASRICRGVHWCPRGMELKARRPTSPLRAPGTGREMKYSGRSGNGVAFASRFLARTLRTTDSLADQQPANRAASSRVS